MKEYLFYIEGLDREAWQLGESERDAYRKLFEAIPDDEQDCVVILECIDERPALAKIAESEDES